MEESGQLSEEEARYLAAIIDSRTDLQERGCPACGHGEFEFQVELRAIASGGLEGRMADRGAMYAELTCENCSRAQFFNADHLHRQGFEIDEE